MELLVNKSKKWLAAAAIVAVLAGCARTAPVKNVETVVATGHSVSQVHDAILKAGLVREWAMTDVSPGVIKGRLQARDHTAEIRIVYSATSYSINYESSINLMAANGKIHKNYNRWVHNLDNAIKLNLASSGRA